MGHTPVYTMPPWQLAEQEHTAQQVPAEEMLHCTVEKIPPAEQSWLETAQHAMHRGVLLP